MGKIGEALLMTGGLTNSSVIKPIVCETSMRSLSISRRTNIVKQQAGSGGRTTFMQRRRALPTGAQRSMQPKEQDAKISFDTCDVSIRCCASADRLQAGIVHSSSY